MATKVPKTINGKPVYADDRWIMKQEGKPDEKMVSIRAKDENDFSLWEMRVSDGRIFHMMDESGDLI